MHILEKLLKLEYFGKSNTKTMQNSAKIGKNNLFLRVSGDHPIFLKSLKFVEKSRYSYMLNRRSFGHVLYVSISIIEGLTAYQNKKKIQILEFWYYKS